MAAPTELTNVTCAASEMDVSLDYEQPRDPLTRRSNIVALTSVAARVLDVIVCAMLAVWSALAHVVARIQRKPGKGADLATLQLIRWRRIVEGGSAAVSVVLDTEAETVQLQRAEDGALFLIIDVADIVNVDVKASCIVFLGPNSVNSKSIGKVSKLARLQLRATDSRALASFLQTLYHVAFPHGPLRFTAFVSPASGSGLAMQLWQEVAMPILTCSPHDVSVVVTTHRGHAEEHAERQALADNEVYVAVGGDGMMHEIINGYVRRRRRATGTNVVAAPLPALPRIGHFPAGSGCAFAKEYEFISHIEATLGLVHARSVAINLYDVKVHELTNSMPAEEDLAHASWQPTLGRLLTERVGFITACFSSTSAVDIESEKYRWMGNGRFIFDIVLRIFIGRIFFKYQVRYRAARVSEVPPANIRSDAEGCIEDDERLDGIDAIRRYIPARREDGSYAPLCGSVLKPLHPVYLQSPTDRFPRKGFENAPHTVSEWVTVPHSQFAILFAMNIAYLAQDWLADPFAAGDDGCLDLLYSCKNFTRLSWILGIPKMMTGDVAEAGVRFAKCKEIEITTDEGYFSLDGERMPLGCIRLTALPPEQGVRVVIAPKRVRPRK
jgi:diacylglycerol kinase family enzyme